jgi:hypothetical protein
MIKTRANSYKGREVDANERVAVYRNLHADCLSIQIGSLVHGHAQMVALYDATFHVGASGNASVRKRKQKDIHAKVRGTIVMATDVDNVEDMYRKLEDQGYERVYYNPYKVTTFVRFDSKEPVFEAKQAIIVLDRVYIK